MRSPIVIEVGAVNQAAADALIKCAKALHGVSDAHVSEGKLVVTAGADLIAADVMAALTREGLHWIPGSMDSK